MSKRLDRDVALRALVPINRLTPELQRGLVDAAEVLPVFAGDIIYTQGQKDDYVHYLLDGDAELLWNGKVVHQVSAASRAGHRAIDAPGRKQHTVRALTHCTIARFSRDEVERAVEQNPGAAGAKELEVSEIAAEVSSNWMIRMLQSPLFAALPATNIQRVFTALEEIAVSDDEIVVKQGSPGDYFYIIEQGSCEVTRDIGRKSGIHLADLGPGEAFGEDALISGQPRNATVTMLTDGRLMRMHKHDFDTLIRKPLLQGLSGEAAIAAATEGEARWLDVRYPEEYARNTLRNSRNLPLNVLRIQYGRLHRDEPYVVCAAESSQAAIGAFLLIERGFAARYLDEPVMALIARHPDIALGPPDAEPVEHKVINFPTGEPVSGSKTRENVDKESQMAPNDPPVSTLESTIDRIDRLYGTSEAEEGMQRRVPVEAYAETKTGVNLANLIDEIDETQAALPERSGPLTKTSPSMTPDVILAGVGAVMDRIMAQEPESPLSRTVKPVERNERLPVSNSGSFANPGGDALRRLLADFEQRLRAHIDGEITSRGMAMERRHSDKIQRLRQMAIAEVKNRDTQLKQRYEQQYRKKEMMLRENYKKLMALANKITEQKAQLQAARKQFEEKVQAANALYRQVEDMRKTLRDQLGSFDMRVNQGNGG